MSYLLGLDEMPEATIEAELDLRRQRRERGVCDYCERARGTKPCKFLGRHTDPRIGERSS